MSYIKTLWVNKVAPAINALNLNKIEQGIYDAALMADIANTEVAKKENSVNGKGLSEEDYTTQDKNKLAGLEGSLFKGVHKSLADLESAHPAVSQSAGGYAYIKTGPMDTEKLAILDTGVWIEQGGTGGGGTLSSAQIKSLYEANNNTNAFTDDDKAKVHDELIVLSGTSDPLNTLGVDGNIYFKLA